MPIPETNNTVIKLRDIITEKLVAAEMTLVDRLDTRARCRVGRIELKVDLFPQGNYYINGKRTPPVAYRESLNRFLLGNDSDILTFRQLINSFVRVSVEGDRDAFLRTVERTSVVVYRSVYNYLFAISDLELDSKLDSLNSERSRTIEPLKRHRDVLDVNEIDEQRQVLVGLEREYEQTKQRADDIIDAGECRRNRKALARVCSEYMKLSDTLSELDYRIEKSSAALYQAHQENARQADISLSRRFFDEVCPMIPEVKKTFEDMVRFNRSLCDNTISYCESLQKKLEDERVSVLAQRDGLTKNKTFLSLVADDKIDEYEHPLSALMDLKQQIGERMEVIATMESYDEERKRIDEAIESYSTGGSARTYDETGFQARMDFFNSFSLRLRIG